MANSGRVRERQLDGVEVDVPTPASQPGDVFPAGVVMAFAGSAAPTNWLICDGSVVSRATYPNLFAALGTTYGAGDGSTTFGIPDMRGRSIVGKHTSGTFVTLGQTGGEENHTIAVGELPSHTHGINAEAPGTDVQGSHTHSGNGNNYVTDGATGGAHQWGTSGVAVSVAAGGAQTPSAGSHSHTVNSHSHGGATTATGSGTAANNMHPYFVIHWIIKAS